MAAELSENGATTKKTDEFYRHFIEQFFVQNKVLRRCRNNHGHDKDAAVNIIDKIKVEFQACFDNIICVIQSTVNATE